MGSHGVMRGLRVAPHECRDDGVVVPGRLFEDARPGRRHAAVLDGEGVEAARHALEAGVFPRGADERVELAVGAAKRDRIIHRPIAEFHQLREPIELLRCDLARRLGSEAGVDDLARPEQAF